MTEPSPQAAGEFTMTPWIQGAMLVIMVGSLVGAMCNRWQLERGIGGRTIQFVGLAWVLGIANDPGP